jgi:hypothetical protein
MNDKFDPTLLHTLVKALDTELTLIAKITQDERVVAWSKVQGILLTISSEAMGLVSDTAMIIGNATTNASTSATDKIINDLLATIDTKGKGEN